MTPGGASGYPTTLESLSHVADSLHTRRGRCETGEKETLRISTDHAGLIESGLFFVNISTLQHELLRSGCAHFFFLFFFWALWAP